MAGETCEIGILFGDIAGSTRLYEELGDRAALTAIDRTLALVSDVVTRFRGQVVKTIGDELMAAFTDPLALFDASIEIQRSIDAMPPLQGGGGERRILLKIGFHYGSALATDGDYFGDTVNVAARMVGLAKGGQIITTAEVMLHLLPLQRASARSLDCVPVRGKAEAIEIMEVLWQETSELTVLPAALLGRGPSIKRDLLRLTYAGRDWVFAADERQISVGREAGNHLVVIDTRASRRHLTIERRRENWVLIDHSSNGTFVAFTGGETIELRRQELMLHGGGTIAMGQAVGIVPDGEIAFAVEGR